MKKRRRRSPLRDPTDASRRESPSKGENFVFIVEEIEFSSRRLPTSAKTLARTPSARFTYFPQTVFIRVQPTDAPLRRVAL